MRSDDIKKQSPQDVLDEWAEDLKNPAGQARNELNTLIARRLREKLGPPRSDTWPRAHKDGAKS